MLQGERVLLRPAREADVAVQAGFFRDPVLAGLDAGAPHERAFLDVAALLRPGAGGEPSPDSSTLTLAIETEGAYVGYASLMHLDDPRRTFELGINIGDPGYRDRGYGQECVRLLLHYAFHYLNGRRVELTTHADNARAIGCYAKCGFVEEGRLRQALWIEGRYVDAVLMAILREEWRP